MSGWEIFGGVAVIVIGFFLTWKAYPLYRVTGAIPLAERYFESFGGTFGFYRFLGIVAIIIGFLYLSGACNYIAVQWVGVLFGGAKK